MSQAVILEDKKIGNLCTRPLKKQWLIRVWWTGFYCSALQHGWRMTSLGRLCRFVMGIFTVINWHYTAQFYTPFIVCISLTTNDWSLSLIKLIKWTLVYKLILSFSMQLHFLRYSEQKCVGKCVGNWHYAKRTCNFRVFRQIEISHVPDWIEWWVQYVNIPLLLG